MEQETISALLVHSWPGPLDELRSILAGLGVKTVVARSCGEAALFLWGERPPHMVFTDRQLGDGTWADMVTIAAKAPAAVRVTVISRLVDIRLYLEALERGAFDFLAPPFDPLGVATLLRTVSWNPVKGRKGEGRVAAPQEALWRITVEGHEA